MPLAALACPVLELDVTKSGTVERSRPLLGTFVQVMVSADDRELAHERVEAAFAAGANLHSLLSFHLPTSDISRLNREAAITPVRVSDHTYEVIRLALEIAAASAGLFDITVANQLVAQGLLPRPSLAPAPDPLASWQDIELLAPPLIRFRRPLWIDVGGIAKGYAVDQATEIVQRDSLRCRINAGGDLRVAGAWRDRVMLSVPDHPAAQLPTVELANASLASSGTPAPKENQIAASSPYIHGRERHTLRTGRFVAVVAPRCVIADALTKIVLIDADGAAAVLQRYDATAYLYDRRLHGHHEGWRTLGGKI